MSPTPTGRLDGATLIIEREFDATVDDLWRTLTDSDRTARWIGPWSGNPASGEITTRLSAEEGAPESAARILECTEPHRLVVVVGVGSPFEWELSVDVSATETGARLQLTQILDDPRAAAEIGPGWEFYLDRFTAALRGDDPSRIDFSPDYLPGMADHYADQVSKD